MSQLVLSLFPGIGLLDRGFEDEGFAVVRGPDLLWGGDVRKFSPPSGRFDGVIGGPPCQRFSSLARLVVHVHGEDKLAPNLIPEFERVVAEAAPRWFLMENVPKAPEPVVPGFVVRSLMLNNRWCDAGAGIGPEQNRLRRFSFGTREGLKLKPRVAVFEAPRVAAAVLGPGGGGNRPHAIALGGSGKPKKVTRFRQLAAAPTVTANCTTWDPEKGRPRSFRSTAYLREAIRLQGLPADFDLPGFTVDEKIRAVGNGVPYPMARAIAHAVRESVESSRLALPLAHAAREDLP